MALALSIAIAQFDGAAAEALLDAWARYARDGDLEAMNEVTERLSSLVPTEWLHRWQFHVQGIIPAIEESTGVLYQSAGGPCRDH